MSAATMIACAADRIIMGKHSFLGPTDPQFFLSTPLGRRMIAAQTLMDQFAQAERECEDPAKLPVWVPMLNQFGPDLLAHCETALALSKELVQRWLETYMFAGDPGGSQKAEALAEWLADHHTFKSHSRHLPRTELIDHGLEIDPLEEDRTFQDLVLSVFHATIHTFTGTPSLKIVENHMGRAYIKFPAPSSNPPSLKIDIGGKPAPSPTPPNLQ